MLTLAAASRYFDRTPVVDPFTDDLLFYGQVDPYSDAVRDSATAYRRILSVASGTRVYEGTLVSVFGEVWIVGASETDGLSTPHRVKYVLHPAKYKLAIRSLSDYVSGAPYTPVWGDVSWVKDLKTESTTSSLTPAYALYVPHSVAIPEHSVVQVLSKPVDSYYEYCFNGTDPSGMLTGMARMQASGIRSAPCTQIADSPADAVLTRRVYSPVTGGYTASVPTTVKCLRVRWQSLYLYGSQGDAKFQEGDCSLVMPAGTVLGTKDTLTLAGQAWSILAVETLGGATVAQGRRA